MPTNGNNVSRTPDKAAEARRKFVHAFNSTMEKIWLEKITLLQVYDTGVLYRSIRGISSTTNADASEFSVSQGFKTYGIWQNYGVGRETPRGNPGDIGRAKVRKKKKWFDPKYFGSVYNLRDFMCESFAQQYLAIFTNAFSDRALRQQTTQTTTSQTTDLPF